MADYLGSGADKSCCRNTLDLDCIVCDKTVAALYKLDCGLALTYAAVAEDKDTLAVNLNQNTVSCDSRCELNVQICDGRRNKVACILCGGKHRYVV